MLFKRSENHGFSRYICLLLLLIIFLAFSLFLAVSLGSVTIDIQDTYQIIFSKLGFSLGTGKLSPSTIAIVWNMRVPRVLLGILAGAGLSVCGSVMQSTVNNQIHYWHRCLYRSHSGISSGTFYRIHAGKNDDKQSDFIRNSCKCPFYRLFQLYHFRWCQR